MPGHGLQQRRRIGDHVDEFDALGLGEQRGDAFTHQEVVIREDNSQHHSIHCGPREALMPNTMPITPRTTSIFQPTANQSRSIPSWSSRHGR